MVDVKVISTKTMELKMCNPIEIMRNCEKRKECAQSVFNMGDPMCDNSNCIMFDHLGLVNAYRATVSKKKVESSTEDIESKIPDTDLPCEIDRCIGGNVEDDGSWIHDPDMGSKD